MPRVFESNGYLVYFWSNEEQYDGKLEPVHVHISKKPTPNATKYWITSFGIAVNANGKPFENTSKSTK